MSYISGFMMGAALGKGVRRFLAGKPTALSAPGYGQITAPGAAPPAFALVSSVPGRRRYRVPNLSVEMARLLEEKLAKLDFLKEIKTNPKTGSILFIFSPSEEKKVDSLAQCLSEKIFATKVATKTNKNLSPGLGAASPQWGLGQSPNTYGAMPSEAHAGDVTKAVRRSVRDFSGWIKKVTGGLFDVSSLASLLFLLRGLRKMMLTKQYPSGSQMLWWAVSLMRGWRTV
ncbi:MAG: hypothetical protein IJ849_10215 [Selenomonadaceae bacterium]|nr:hypothetical protein [Selenomonadaceae bacterium]